MKTTSIMIVGVGGQGSLLASRLLGTVLTDEVFKIIWNLKDKTKYQNIMCSSPSPREYLGFAFERHGF